MFEYTYMSKMFYAVVPIMCAYIYLNFLMYAMYSTELTTKQQLLSFANYRGFKGFQKSILCKRLHRSCTVDGDTDFIVGLIVVCSTEISADYTASILCEQPILFHYRLHYQNENK